MCFLCRYDNDSMSKCGSIMGPVKLVDMVAWTFMLDVAFLMFCDKHLYQNINDML